MKHHYLVFALLALLTSCSSDDEGPVPTDFNFREVATIEGALLDQGGGMLGYASDNSIFFAHRVPQNGNSERILKYNLNDDTSLENFFALNDFVTKRMHIRGNELMVIGGSYINTYNLSLTADPESVAHGSRLTRFGSFLYNNEIYIFGGDLDETDSDKIKKWNESSQVFETVATLPEPRLWTNGEVVGGKLYIFGGQQDFAGGFGEPEIYIVDLSDFSTEIMRLPEDYNRAFVTAIGENVFVAGQVWRNDRIDTRLGWFNTQDNTFQEVTFNLDDEGNSSIFGLASVDNRLYALHRRGEGTSYTLQEIIL